MTPTPLVLLILLIGAATFSIRFFFLWLVGRVTLSPLAQRLLRFVPVAVLPALVAPALFYRAGALDLSLDNARLVAGLVAVLVAARTRNVLATLAVGMGLLWLLQALR